MGGRAEDVTELRAAESGSNAGAGSYSDSPTSEIQALLSDPGTFQEGLRVMARYQGYSAPVEHLTYTDGCKVRTTRTGRRYYDRSVVADVTPNPTGGAPFVTFYKPSTTWRSYHALASIMDHEAVHFFQHRKELVAGRTSRQVELPAYEYQFSRPSFEAAPAMFQWRMRERYLELGG